MRSAETAVDIRPLSVAELSLAAGDLIHAHWEEVARMKDIMVLDPDWPRYEILERQGVLLSLGVYVDEKLVGYSLGLVIENLHYRNLTYYQNDVLYLSPVHRRSRLGLALIDATETAAATRGARYIAWHAKPGTALERLLPTRGYEVQDIVFTKRAPEV